ncbi:hypothetical protein OH77DRAFT_642270 [Trametes cingulata]|nr:hypothetical protein OH77DRAFT_642270 [Trametes cingulata]
MTPPLERADEALSPSRPLRGSAQAGDQCPREADAGVLQTRSHAGPKLCFCSIADCPACGRWPRPHRRRHRWFAARARRAERTHEHKHEHEQQHGALFVCRASEEVGVGAGAGATGSSRTARRGGRTFICRTSAERSRGAASAKPDIAAAVGVRRAAACAPCRPPSGSAIVCRLSR